MFVCRHYHFDWSQEEYRWVKPKYRPNTDHSRHSSLQPTSNSLIAHNQHIRIIPASTQFESTGAVIKSFPLARTTSSYIHHTMRALDLLAMISLVCLATPISAQQIWKPQVEYSGQTFFDE